MSSIEEQLARDIAAVTQGVVMTDSDLREARDRMEERIDLKRRRDRRRTTLGALVAAVVIPVLAFTAFQALDGDEKTVPPVDPGPSASVDPEADFLTGSAPTMEALAGVWRVDNGVTMLSFDADGNVSFDDRGQLFSSPAVVGHYAVERDVITIWVIGGAAGCEGQEIHMRASLPAPGAGRIVQTEPGSGACAPEQNGRWALEQELPTSPDLRELVFSSDKGWEPVSDPTTLHGDWQAEGGGHILELAPDGTYLVAAAKGSSLDRGRWSFSETPARLSLVSDDVGPCRTGDRLVLGGLEQIDPGTTVIRGTVEENTCSAAWTPKAWILIPHKDS
jgi:hypothetical protein